MEYWPVCHVCKTAYIAAVNRMRCESCTDPKHQLRDPGRGMYQPCLIPSVADCGKLVRLKRWWDDLPRPEAIKLLQGSTRFGRFYLQLEGHVLHQLVKAGCSDVHTLARHPLVLQSTPHQAPSATYVVAAGTLFIFLRFVKQTAVLFQDKVSRPCTQNSEHGNFTDRCRSGTRYCKLDV